MFDIIFHQISATLVCFGIFFLIFNFFFKNPITTVLTARISENSLLKNLIQKNIDDKNFYYQESILLNKMRKDKIDNFVIKNLSKDEKIWRESLLDIKIEAQNVLISKNTNEDIQEHQIDQLIKTLKRRYG